MSDMQRGGDLMDPRRGVPDKEALTRNRDERILRDCLKTTGGDLQDVCDETHIQVWQAEIEELKAEIEKNQPLIDVYERCIAKCKANSERRKARQGN